jgi:hypothetical protein
MVLVSVTSIAPRLPHTLNDEHDAHCDRAGGDYDATSSHAEGHATTPDGCQRPAEYPDDTEHHSGQCRLTSRGLDELLLLPLASFD